MASGETITFDATDPMMQRLLRYAQLVGTKGTQS
jgi:hypothetical protein